MRRVRLALCAAGLAASFISVSAFAGATASAQVLSANPHPLVNPVLNTKPVTNGAPGWGMVVHHELAMEAAAEAAAVHQAQLTALVKEEAAAAAAKAAAPFKYTVVTGDTLTGIASKFNTDLQALQGVNHIADINLIHSGDVLTVKRNWKPGGAIVWPAPSPAPVIETTYNRPTPQPVQHYSAPSGGYSISSSYQACVIQRESGGNPTATNSSSGASGLYQFLPSTWQSVTGLPGVAADYSVAVQTAAFNKLYAAAGSSPWSSDGC